MLRYFQFGKQLTNVGLKNLQSGILPNRMTYQPQLYFSSGKQGWFDRWFSEQAYTAKESTKNRWLMIVPAFACHLCIGSPWAWSIMANVINREIGFVVPSHMDWTSSDSVLPLSFVFAFQGLSASIVGKYQTKYGLRASMAFAAFLFGGGLMIGSLGIYLHSLPILYFGYGILAGCGIGVAYTPPIQALMKWFPDKKGVASGFTIAGFGSGALLFGPLISRIMKHFTVLPTYLGPTNQVNYFNKDGVFYTEIGGNLREIVIANQAEISKLGYQELQEGVYLAGTGSTGAAPSLAILGAMYFSIMMGSAFILKNPHPSFQIPQNINVQAANLASTTMSQNVTPDVALKLPQLYQMFTILLTISAGGIAVMGVSKTMMFDVFMKALPETVDPTFCNNYVLILSFGNLIGRLGWAVFSEKYGRRTTFAIFGLASMPLYASLPYYAAWVTASPSHVPLYLFIGSTFMIVNMVGGTFALLPAYEADIFGSKYVGNIHGKVLLSLSFSALGGPKMIAWLKEKAEIDAFKELLQKVDPTLFLQKFGQSIENAEALIKTKSLTISKLMEIMPPGTVDPTPFLYDSSFYTLSSFMIIAALSNYTIKKVNPKYFESIPPPPSNPPTKKD